MMVRKDMLLGGGENMCSGVLNKMKKSTHANITLSSRETCWSLSTEQSWSRDKGCGGERKEKVGEW